VHNNEIDKILNINAFKAKIDINNILTF
jgi:DNA-binding CsgD family transcriptional regulator